MIEDVRLTMDYREYLALKGCGFQLKYINQSVAAGASVYLKANTPTTKNLLFISRQIITDISEQRYYRAYAGEGFGFSGGTPGANIPITNVNSASPILTQSIGTVWNTPTLMAQGLVVEIPFLDKSNATPSGDFATDTDLTVFAPNQQLMIQFQNAGNSACYFQLTLKWFEVSDEFVPSFGAV